MSKKKRRKSKTNDKKDLRQDLRKGINPVVPLEKGWDYINSWS